MGGGGGVCVEVGCRAEVFCMMQGELDVECVKDGYGGKGWSGGPGERGRRLGWGFGLMTKN